MPKVVNQLTSSPNHVPVAGDLYVVGGDTYILTYDSMDDTFALLSLSDGRYYSDRTVDVTEAIPPRATLIATSKDAVITISNAKR